LVLHIIDSEKPLDEGVFGWLGTYKYCQLLGFLNAGMNNHIIANRDRFGRSEELVLVFHFNSF